MTKRPISLGALILILILYIGNCFGVSETVPQSFPEEGSKIRILGKVQAKEQTGYGIRLYLEECSIFPFISKKSIDSSFQKSFYQSEFQIEDDSQKETKKWNKILVYLKQDEKVSVGNWVLAEGNCGYFETATNPGQFDTENYYEARGIRMMLKKGEIVSSWRQQSSYEGILSRIRDALNTSMEKVMGAEDAALTAAITLGVREGLSTEKKQLYQEGGIAHILAISSLHITLIGMGMYRLLRKLRCPLVISAGISGIFLFSFCVMTGMSVSAKRACVMYLLWLGSQILGRTNDQPTALGLASMVILAPSPAYLWDSSFLLSFGCVLSLLCVLPLMKVILPVPGSLGASLQASAAIQLGTLPLIMTFFYQVTPYGVLVNLAVIPFMGVLMVSGLLAAVIGLFSLPAGVLAAAPCHYLLEWFEWLCRMERRLPGAVVITGCPKVWQSVVYYGILFLLCGLVYRWNRQTKKSGRTGLREGFGIRFAGYTGVGLAVLILSLRFLPQLRIAVLDVGQGDGILIQAGEFACMVDAGSSSEDQVWQYRVESTLKYYGISRLDAVFVSHGDYDHISGVQELLENYETGPGGNNTGGITVERLILPDIGYREEKLQKLAALAREKGVPVGTLPAGGSVSSEELKLTCLYPDTEYMSGDPNQDSMVLLLEYKDFTALFTGDLEEEGEDRFLQNRALEKEIDLLKVAHHGSKNSTSKKFLEKIAPEMAVISCGKDNLYGHPAEEVLIRLEEVGTDVYRTDEQGAVIFEFRNGEIKSQ